MEKNTEIELKKRYMIVFKRIELAVIDNAEQVKADYVIYSMSDDKPGVGMGIIKEGQLDLAKLKRQHDVVPRFTIVGSKYVGELVEALKQLMYADDELMNELEANWASEVGSSASPG